MKQQAMLTSNIERLIRVIGIMPSVGFTTVQYKIKDVNELSHQPPLINLFGNKKSRRKDSNHRAKPNSFLSCYRS